ncbi:MAG TPA: DUF4238 domain-containing protein [Terracidiphilus sp.]|nr:DUF4238 domain-containing protein [Terracidiphilus sp.]
MPLDHYVSQVYLKNFYSPVLGNLMYATRKSDLKSFTPNSESVCRTIDGSTNPYLKESRAVEDFLKTIEPKYNGALAKLISDNIDEECIYTIGGFVAYFLSCSPAGMRIQSGPLKSIVEAEASILETSGRLPQPPRELGGANLAGLLSTGAVEVDVDQKFPQAIGINSILQFIAIFGNFRWDILLNDFNDSPFFTSDFPVAIEKTRDCRIINRIVPLAPNLAIRIRPDLTIDKELVDLSFANFHSHRRKISQKEAVEINRLIVRCAEDTVFYRDDLAWVKGFIAKNRHYRVESTASKQRTGNSFLLTSRLEIVPVAAPHESPA